MSPTVLSAASTDPPLSNHRSPTCQWTCSNTRSQLGPQGAAAPVSRFSDVSEASSACASASRSATFPPPIWLPYAYESLSSRRSLHSLLAFRAKQELARILHLLGQLYKPESSPHLHFRVQALVRTHIGLSPTSRILAHHMVSFAGYHRNC